MVRILTPKESYTVDYPEAIAFSEAQEDINWMAREIEMEKDLHDIHNTLTEQELHGVTEGLRLFTQYELHVGNEYWLDYVRKVFPRPEIQRMASVFGMIELNVHAPFYDRLNEVMGLKSDEFYTSYVEDEVLKQRMEWIGRQFTTKDPLLTAAIGSITEGAILYSNFAFFKHFQAEGKNKLRNLTAGINFSVRDENLHSLAGAWLFKTLRKEMQEEGTLHLEPVMSAIYETCDQVLEHEEHIIDKFFEKGEMANITAHQMKQFIRARLNVCLNQLELDPLYEVDYDPISKWFYKNINSSHMNDIFHSQGREYVRDWSESAFEFANVS